MNGVTRTAAVIDDLASAEHELASHFPGIRLGRVDRDAFRSTFATTSGDRFSTMAYSFEGAGSAMTGTQDLVMLVKGNLTSRFADTAPPVLTNEDGTTRTVEDSSIKKRSSDEARVVVAGSALFLVNQVLEGAPTNALLPLNLAESYTRGGDLPSLDRHPTVASQVGAVVNPAAVHLVAGPHLEQARAHRVLVGIDRTRARTQLLASRPSSTCKAESEAGLRQSVSSLPPRQD